MSAASVTRLFGEDGTILYERQFQVILLANLISPMGIALLSPVLANLTVVFDVSQSEIGLIITVYSAPSIVLIPIVGMVSDRVGRKPVLLAGLLTFGLAGSAISLTDDFRIMLGLRMLQGIAFAGLLPVIITIIGDLYEDGRETTAHGIRFASTGFTHTVFPVIAGFIIVFAWQSPFLLYLIAIPIAGLVYFQFEETLTGSERDENRDSGHAGYVRELAASIRRRRILAILFAYSLPQFLIFVFWTLNSFLIVDILNKSVQQAGLLVAAFSIVYAVAATQTGKFSSMFDDRINMLIGANICLLFGFGIVAFSPSFLGVVAGSIVCGIGIGVTLSVYRALLTDTAQDAYRGGLVSIGESIGRIGGTIAPVLAGFSVEYLTSTLGYSQATRWTLFASAMLCGIGGIASMLVFKYA